jgi:dihydrofolate synthase / folylpolyglutamate synthase
MGLERILVPELPGNPRAWPAAELARLLGKKARPVRDMAEAMALLQGSAEPVLVCGSIYLLGELYKLHPDLLEIKG